MSHLGCPDCTPDYWCPTHHAELRSRYPRPAFTVADINDFYRQNPPRPIWWEDINPYRYEPEGSTVSRTQPELSNKAAETVNKAIVALEDVLKMQVSVKDIIFMPNNLSNSVSHMISTLQSIIATDDDQ